MEDKNQEFNKKADISETFGTLKRKMSGQEFKDLVRNIEPIIQEDDKENWKKSFQNLYKPSIYETLSCELE